MKLKQSSQPIYSIAILVVSILVFGACNPALYRRPAQDFQAASATLRDTYFLEWEISNKAQIERGDIEDQILIWTSPSGVSTAQLERVSSRMAERRKNDIHDQLRPLREQAFNAVEGYAATLVSLSSDEPTERIQLELNGLAKDITSTLDAVDKINLVGSALERSQQLTGPLQQYVDVLNQVITIVSSVLRERAIIETIGNSNESISDLLSILKGEAAVAEENALRQIGLAKKSIKQYMSHSKFQQATNVTKTILLKRKAELEAIEHKIANQDIASTFDAALKAQGALVKKAMLKNPGDWTLKIRQFREQVVATKKAIEKIKSEM
jgi:hypothetical protein